MAIPSVAGLGSSTPSTTPGIVSPLLGGAVGMISQQLGLDQGSLERALAGGASVDELATRQGISSSELQSAVVAHLGEARAQAGQAPISSESLARLVSRAFAQGRRSAPGDADAPSGRRGAISVYGSAGRMVDEPVSSAISVLA